MLWWLEDGESHQQVSKTRWRLYGQHWSLEATNESEKFVGAVWGLARWREEKCEQERVKNDSFLLVVARVVKEGEDGQNKSFLTRSACWWLLRLREV